MRTLLALSLLVACHRHPSTETGDTDSGDPDSGDTDSASPPAPDRCDVAGPGVLDEDVTGALSDYNQYISPFPITADPEEGLSWTNVQGTEPNYGAIRRNGWA